MNPEADLHALYAEWRRLTEQEREAIGRGQWEDLLQRQALKQELKPKIISATETWGGAAPDRRRQDYEAQFRPIVDELIGLETQNHELLCARQQHCRAELDRLQQSARHLRDVRRAYATPGTSWWSSYS